MIVSLRPKSLPQNHIFNPSLPPTPLRKMNPSDVLLTVNGSPIANPLSSRSNPVQNASGPSRSGSSSGTPAASRLYSSRQEPATIEDDNEDEEDEGEAAAEDREEGSGDDSDVDELPDPEAYESRLAASVCVKSKTVKSVPARLPKRAPSLVFSQPLQGAGPSVSDRDPSKSYLPYKGQVIVFEPLNLKPVEMDLDMTLRGLSLEEQEEVRGLVQKEVVAVLDRKRQAWGIKT